MILCAVMRDLSVNYYVIISYISSIALQIVILRNAELVITTLLQRNNQLLLKRKDVKNTNSLLLLMCLFEITK